MLGAYSGGWVDDLVNFATNVFLVIPTIPLLVVVSAYLKSRGSTSMILILAFTLWAFEARVLRAQALSLRNRDFILAAKVAGESTWRIIFFELMPNMISRIAAAFVLVFYVSILTEAGLEFLGLGNMSASSWGVTLYWAQVNSSVLQGEWWTFLFPGLALALDRRRARLHPRGSRRGLEPAAAQARGAAPDARRPALRTRPLLMAVATERAARASRTSRSSTCSPIGACARSTASRSRSRRARSSGSPASRAAARAPSRTRCCRS